MGGFDPDQLEWVAELIGAQDIEMLIHGLLQLRDYQQKLNEASRGN
jgi:hypothetical protein